MINFAVGPVMMEDDVLSSGAQQIPYFRTQEFSNIMIENEKMIKECLDADEKSKVIFLTSSGTGAMEASVMNVFNKQDKVLVVNGGSFGRRFKEICDLHEIPNEEIKLDFGQPLTKEKLDRYKGKGFTGFLINIHETSTGMLYDIDLVSSFCREENIFLMVDAISSFLADEINMKKSNIDLLITGSQKALALPPGIAVVALSIKAVEKIHNNKVKSMYFDFNDYLKNAQRGQTPFTPAVGILIQLNIRLKNILKKGVKEEIKRVANLASDFRNRISDFPFEIASVSPSNAMTPIRVKTGVSAYKIFEIMKDEYNIFICPNGGELKDKIFRIGHIGALTISDNDKLIDAFKDMQKRGILK